MALIACSECGKEISDKATACPHCGKPVGAFTASATDQFKVASCASCNVALVAVEKKDAVSICGLLSVILVLIGFISLFINFVGGILVLILAAIVGLLGRGKKTVMVCPQCGAPGATLRV